jgi:hypothetical protein
MRKGIAVSIVLISLLAVAAGAAVATSQPELTTARTIRLMAQAGHFKSLDVGRDGPSIGDQYFLSGTLLDRTKTNEVGRFDVTCGLTDTKAQINNCQATFTLAGGEIVTGGVSQNSGAPDVDAVYGGTGVYQNARGAVHVGDSSGQFISIVLRLLP